MAYTYAFTASNGTDLEAIASTPWVNVRTANSAEVQSNQLAPVASKVGAYYYNATFADAHYAKLVFKVEAGGGGDYVIACIRVIDGSNYYYSARGGATTIVYNGELVSGVDTDWDSGLTGCAVNDSWGLYVSASTATTVYYKVNDSTVATYTGKTLSGGRAGVGANGNGATQSSRADDWEGGNVVTAYTLTADAGSYTYTGQAATLKIDRKFTADAGAYTYTGNAAGVYYGYKVAADAGSYNLSGQDATLKLARKFELDNPATYTYTGNAANLLHGLNLPADSGSYTYTGQDANTLHGLNIVADSGAYTYTGQDASLLHNLSLPADAGAYTYTGQDATINKGFTLAGDAGAYTYAGQDAGLLHYVTVAADGGVYTYAGQDATLTYTPTGATYQQEGYRWRDDDGDEDAATWRAAQDTTSSIPQNTNVRLRVLVNTSGDTAAAEYQLEYRIAGSSDDWTVIA